MEQTQPLTGASWAQGIDQCKAISAWVQHVTFHEDRSQVRAGSDPTVMATLCNIAITGARLASWGHTAKAVRHYSTNCRWEEPVLPAAVTSGPPAGCA
jgi:hypothetical protein